MILHWILRWNKRLIAKCIIHCCTNFFRLSITSVIALKSPFYIATHASARHASSGRQRESKLRCTQWPHWMQHRVMEGQYGSRIECRSVQGGVNQFSIKRNVQWYIDSRCARMPSHLGDKQMRRSETSLVLHRDFTQCFAIACLSHILQISAQFSCIFKIYINSSKWFFDLYL